MAGAGIINGMRADHARHIAEVERMKKEGEHSGSAYGKGLKQLEQRDLAKEKAELERLLKEKEDKELADKVKQLEKLKEEAPKIEEEMRKQVLGIKDEKDEVK